MRCTRRGCVVICSARLIVTHHSLFKISKINERDNARRRKYFRTACAALAATGTMAMTPPSKINHMMAFVGCLPYIDATGNTSNGISATNPPINKQSNEQ